MNQLDTLLLKNLELCAATSTLRSENHKLRKTTEHIQKLIRDEQGYRVEQVTTHKLEFKKS